MVLKYLKAAKLLARQKTRVDNVMFHLHYRVTFSIFAVASALVTAKEYFGKPISCYSLRNPVPQNVLETYCFIMSTYSVPKHNTTGPNVVYPGVGPHDDSDQIIYHSYYQWVPLMLFFQALTFYFPRMLWKSLEGGLFTSILQGMDKISLDEGSKNNKFLTLKKYMLTHMNMHRNWAIRFFLCELLCLVIVVSNIYLTDLFLGGTFMSYGSEILKLPSLLPEERQDPMDKVFPRVTKCTFRKFGASGTIETHDSMCVLAVNILNVKLYIFLWYWMVSLTTVTSLWLLYRMLTMVSGRLRGYLLNWRGRLAGREVVTAVGHHSSLGDWFLLYHLGRCMHPIDFGAFLRHYAKELSPIPLEPSAPTADIAYDTLVPPPPKSSLQQ